MRREAVILAGGFGTRLSCVISDVPKTMAPVAGRPFLKYLLDQLKEAQFERVVIADGYKREAIESFFGNSYRGMEVVYSSEDEPLLTGGATKRALNDCSQEWVYVLNGDTYFETEFDAFEAILGTIPARAQIIMAAKPMQDFDRYGTVDVDDSGMVRAFHEKSRCFKGLMNTGIYFLKRAAFEEMPERFSLETDCLERFASSGTVFAIVQTGSFIDIGIPNDYELAQKLLAPLAKKWKLALFDRDGTINIDTGHLFEIEKLALIESTVDLIRSYTKNPDWKVAVVTNQSGIARGLYGVEQMKRLHSALDRLLSKEGACIDAYYYCPHHPEFTGWCACRKPEPGMLKKALLDFDAEASECIMYGDSERDRMAAGAAGIPFVHIGR